MIYKNIQKYACENWTQYKKEITDCSKPSVNLEPIIECKQEVYCFDDVCKELFSQNSLPTSVDGVDFVDKEIRFIEYKTGFKDKITRDNYKNSEKSICKHSKEACPDYWELFFEKRKKEKEELLLNLKMKALETYVIFEKVIFPLCDDLENEHLQARLIMVVDVDPVDYMEETLGELAGKPTAEDNWHSKIKESMARFRVKKDASGNDYLYDKIDVYSIQEYYKLLGA